ncbi:substrate-binding domain-containing protein [Spongiactinospora sp. TRM90649]|uniref:LacI family DNA-binding transcriptional regulator n=1 Tax=Spongiactinospora sp. TRM90649 TaxID=3031114 RepID=UPI0023F668F9|nr:substrate-binding domain-containing protein [Spongiactinospora sp. TRM90649]MDF5752889.1 substrate-binding domain-containing protein [Spongiactinospora sp. TRM90649]
MAHPSRCPDVIGLVLTRPVRSPGVEPLRMEFVAGVEEGLAEREMPVLLSVVTTHEAEIVTYRRWAARKLVAAAIVVDLAEGDRRPAVLREVGLPAVLAGGCDDAETATPAVRTDERGAAAEVLDRLLALGHRRIARVTGSESLLRTRVRTAALVAGCLTAGIEPPMLAAGDCSEKSGARLTAALLRREDRPTAVLYDDEVLAAGGLAAARSLGLAVPGQVSLVAWDDLAVSRPTAPPLTVMSVDVHRFGLSVAASILELADGLPVSERWSPAATYVPRGTTGPAPDESGRAPESHW